MSRYPFVPSGDQARGIDRNMRRILGESLQHIADRTSGVLNVDWDALNRLVKGLNEGRRYPPSTFALYADLVFALQNERFPEAAELIAILVKEQPVEADSWQVISLDEEMDSGRDQLYQRYMDTDPNIRFGIIPPSKEEAADFRRRLQSGFRLMSKALPELADEFNGLVNQVIMVSGDPNDAYQFDGGSSYMLWGGLFLNVTSHENDVAIVEVLAHESAHILLFGFTSDEPLVLNEDDELFPSPLRVDPRPMDGIYHATFVSARMHWAMSKLLESGLLDDDGRQQAESARAADKKNFYDGYQVVEAFAVLTDTGKAVMQSAKAYMDAA